MVAYCHTEKYLISVENQEGWMHNKFKRIHKKACGYFFEMNLISWKHPKQRNGVPQNFVYGHYEVS